MANEIDQAELDRTVYEIRKFRERLAEHQVYNQHLVKMCDLMIRLAELPKE